MCFCKTLYAFRCSNDTDKLDLLTTMLLNLVDGIDCRATGRQHRIANDDLTLFDRVRQLTEIFYRLMCGFITVHADMTDLGTRNQCSETGDHAEASTKNRNNGKLTASQHFNICCLNRCIKLDGLRRKVRQCLEAHQHRDFFDELTELVRSGVLITQK